MSEPRPYAALLAKGEDRRQRIMAATQRLLMRNGLRGTTLAQIAREAGISSAGLLHHFESKEQLFHAVLDARDAYDEANAIRGTDILSRLEGVAERFERAPDLVGMFTGSEGTPVLRFGPGVRSTGITSTVPGVSCGP